MKLSVNRAELADALTVAASVAPARTPKPVLQCVLIDVQGDFAMLSATDLEIGVRISVAQVQVDKKGSVLVSADKLGQIVRESGDEIITLESSDNVCHVRGHDSHFQIFAHDPKTFPVVATMEEDADFEVGVNDLREMSGWTSFAAARENTRYAINGVLWEKKGGHLTFVATDGRRLSKATRNVGGNEDHWAIVPIKAMQLFSRVLTESDAKVGVKITSNQIQLKAPRAVMSAALLEGHFPKYEDVIPSDCDKSVEFDTHELLSAVRRAALLTNDESKGVRLAFDKGALTLSSRAPDQGEAVISLPVKYDDNALDIGFNPVFLTDVLRAVSTDTVAFEFKEPNRPGVFRVSDDRLYVVMPVNLS